MSLLLRLLCLSTLASASGADYLPRRGSTSNTTCRCFPGDACWPTSTAWDAFNATVGGRLIATVPIASPCHYDVFGPYDAEACAALQDVWDETATHYSSSSSVMSEFFANQSCEPFYPRDAPCVVGSYVRYAVNASSAADFQATIAFVRANNVRLVIRNTGHDYLGKSTGAGAVAIWTHHLKDIQVLTNYQSANYTGPALKLGAGVQVDEAFVAAHAAGLAVVGGNCQTVGIAGGYSQGGGHGALASVFGMAADNVLEWEVVTGTGELVTASQTENPDLYWALSGGGGSTYGAVVSMTSRAHKDLATSGANLTFTDTGVTQDRFYDVIETFIANVPALNDAGVAIVWLIESSSFEMTPATGPGLTAAQLDDYFAPVLDKLAAYNMSYTYQSHDFDNYLAENLAMDLPYEISNLNIGGRLIPRSLVASDLPALMSAIRRINSYDATIVGISIDASKKAGYPDNAVNPLWRTAAFDVLLGLNYNYTDWEANLEAQELMTGTLMPLLEAITPGGGSYLNEADFREPDYQYAFYGGNWDRLLAIKDKWDPDQVFYARTAVGSNRWAEDETGRLCRVSNGSAVDTGFSR